MFSFGNKKTKTVLVIDISSSAVGAGISIISTEKNTGALSQNIAFVRNTIPLKEHFDVEHFLQTTLTYLSAALQSLQHKTNLVPDMVMCSISSPWFISHSRTISYSELTPFVCTEKLVQSLVAQELEKIKRDTAGQELAIIEQQISQISLNGYTTQSPFDKKASSMNIGLAVTQSTKDCIDRFNTLIHRFYGTVKISYTTTPFAIATVLGNMQHSHDRALIIHIGEQITDVGFIKDGVFLYQHSFPVGMYNLFHIMHEKGVPRGQANTLLDGYKMNAIHDEKRRTVEDSLNAFTKEWSTGLTSILTTGFFGFSTPERAIILCDDRFSLLFQGAIAANPFTNHSGASGKISCSFITPLLFAGSVSAPLDGSADAVGMLITLFSNLYHGTSL